MTVGAKLPPNGQVSHCFALNGNDAHPEVKGLAQIIAAYRDTLNRVTLYGPTIFAQVSILVCACEAMRVGGGIV